MVKKNIVDDQVEEFQQPPESVEDDPIAAEAEAAAAIEIEEEPIEEAPQEDAPQQESSQEPFQMVTPIYLNTPDAEWPDDSVFYVLASNGIFKCRNHPFFTSCVKTDKFPSELEEQKSSFRFRYPRIPQSMLAGILAFFTKIYKKYKSEAIVLLYFNRHTQDYEVVCPEQWITEHVSKFGSNWTSLDVKYKLPMPDPMMVPVASIHSHGNLGAFHSWTDENDEKHFAGIHITIGNVNGESYSISIEAVVDTQRFRVDPELMVDGYGEKEDKKTYRKTNGLMRGKLTDVPNEWMARMSIKQEDVGVQGGIRKYSGGYSGYFGCQGRYQNNDDGWGYGRYSGYSDDDSSSYEKLDAERDDN